FVLLLTMVVNSVRKRKLWFRLSWLLLFTATVGLSVGGFLRVRVAEEAFEKYRAAMVEWYRLPENEKPAHEVTITKPFYMSKYVVTEREYEQVTGKKIERPRGAQYPADRSGD